MDELTIDAVFNGLIKIKQYKQGYRFSIDALLLSFAIKPIKNDIIVDFGTGCGIIPLILAYKYNNIKIYGVELQKELADVALQNVKENNLENIINIFCMDIKKFDKSITKKLVDIVVCNPPYRKINSGRININSQKAIAKHEIKATIDDIISSSEKVLKPSGKLVIIYPAERISDIIIKMRQFGIEPKKIRMIHSTIEDRAKLLLIEGVMKGRHGVIIEKPLVIYSTNGSYTKELDDMLH